MLPNGRADMPRKFLFTKEQIVNAALELIRKKGMDALTARALGEELGSSAKPIFGLFENNGYSAVAYPM